ncbi:MAG: hypothetical protein ACI4XL_05545 [Bacillus sp. (in: firmicutes)]
MQAEYTTYRCNVDNELYFLLDGCLENIPHTEVSSCIHVATADEMFEGRKVDILFECEEGKFYYHNHLLNEQYLLFADTAGKLYVIAESAYAGDLYINQMARPVPVFEKLKGEALFTAFSETIKKWQSSLKQA